MFYVLYFTFGLIAIIVTVAYFKNKADARKRLEAIRDKWGKPFETDRNFNQISLLLAGEDDPDMMTPGTAADIDLENVFNYIDRTNSKPGQQYLYKRLLNTGASHEQLKKLDEQSEKLSQDRVLEERIELELSRLGGSNAYYLPELFRKDHLALFDPLLTFYIKTAHILMVAGIALMIVTHSQVYFLAVLAMLIINMGVHYSNKRKVMQFTHSLPQLLTMIDVAKWLIKHAGLPVVEEVINSLQNISKLKSSLRFVSLESEVAKDPTDLTFAIFELLKIIFLAEPRMFVRSIDKVNKYRPDIKSIYNYVAEIDVLISIHSFRVGLPYYCKPEFSADQNVMVIKELYHPLVENCISNSIATRADQGVLITGSNMSGKTTFIRAIAINTLLAQTVYTCCSKDYQVPWLKIFTSIRISDDIEEHKSYFQAEALSVLDIVNQCGADEPLKSLVIIDEIFRGTNTIERIAAAKAVLAYLTANKNFVFVSTHDLELAELLGADYAVYSFEELVADGTRLVFDYKIKSGLLKNKNGIAILQALGFPDSVVKDANSVGEQLRSKYLL